MKLTKIEPKFIKKHNPRVGLITLASDFRIEKDFNNVIHDKDVDLYCNRIHCYNPLTNETLKKVADDIPKVTEDILPDQKLDCVAYGCTSGTIAAGYSSIVEKVNLANDPTYTKQAQAFKKEVADRWDSEDLRNRIIITQKSRRALHTAMEAGAGEPWDYNPSRDASKEYVRNDMDWPIVAAKTRFPPFNN